MVLLRQLERILRGERSVGDASYGPLVCPSPWLVPSHVIEPLLMGLRVGVMTTAIAIRAMTGKV